MQPLDFPPYTKIDEGSDSYHGLHCFWLKRPDCPRGVVFLLPEEMSEHQKAEELRKALRVLLATEGVCPN